MNLKTTAALVAAGSAATIGMQRYMKTNMGTNKTLKKILAQNEKAMKALRNNF